MLKYLKVINQSNKIVKYTFLTINNWQNWILGTAQNFELGAGVLGSRCSEHGLEGAGLQVATLPGPLWLHLGRVHPQDDRAGP